MPGKTDTENTFMEMKLQKRWEKKYPKLRCVMAEDPEKYRTEHSMRNISRLQQLGYRPIDLTDNERFELMDCNDHILLGCPIEKYQALLRAQREESFIPDKVEDTIG